MAEVVRFACCVFILHTPHYLLCCAPFLEALRIKQRTLVMIIMLTGAVMALVYALRVAYWPAWQQDQFLFLLIFYGLYFVIYKISFDISLFKMIYIFLVVQSYSTLLNVMGKFIDVWFFPEHAGIIGATSYTMIVAGLMILTYPALFSFFKNTFSNIFQIYPDKTFWKLCITPVLFFTINMIYQNALIASFAFLEIYDILFSMFLLLLLTGLVTYYLTLRTTVDMSKAVQARTEVENQVLLQARHYKQLTENIEQTRAARHDLRHHLSVISAYFTQDDKEGLQSYLQDYASSLPDDTMDVYCQNYAVNVLLHHYLGMAKKAGTELYICINLPWDTGIPDSDLSIVFGNILENAARSCCQQKSGPKYIRARCHTSDAVLILVVDNTCEAPVHPSQSISQNHGIGLRSVQAIAEKWGGYLKYTYQEGVFQTSIMMNLPYRKVTPEAAKAAEQAGDDYQT